MKFLPRSPAKRASFFRELARLTGAGLSITRVKEMTGQRWRDPLITAAVRSLQDGLARGESIAEALKPELTSMESAMVTAAEKGGQLDAGFRKLEEHYTLLSLTVVRMRKALLYPAFMLHAAVILPAIVAGVISGGSVVFGLIKGLVMLYAALAALSFGGRWLVERGRTDPRIDRFLELTPVTGPARRCLALARWNTVLHFHLLTGRKMSEGLEAAGEASQTARLNAASARAAAAAESGSEIGPVLQEERAFPDEMASALAAAEFTGTMDGETLRQAQAMNQEAVMRLDTAAEWVPKALYFAVMGFTVFQILKLGGLYYSTMNGFMKDLDLKY